ncbi:MAG: hypothetical protein R2865_09605 [Deinococcales bacterium]
MTGIAVLFHAELMGIVKAGEATLESLGLMIAGEGWRVKPLTCARKLTSLLHLLGM